MHKPKAKRYENIVSIGCVNFNPIWGDKRRTLEKMKSITVEAARQGNNLIVFPELALSGYGCDEAGAGKQKPCAMHEAAAEPVPGPSTRAMAGRF